MNRPRTTIKQMRTAVGVLSLLLFAQTAFWLVYDIADRGPLGAWELWSSGSGSGLAATTSLDLGLAALQLAAGWAALARLRGVGGLLVVSCVSTVAFRLPVVWYMVLDSPSDPWFGALRGPSLTAVGVTCLLAVAVALVLGVLLLRGRRLEAEARAAADLADGGAGRPAKVTAAASSALVAVLNVFYITRNAVTAVQVGPGALTDLLVGRGTGRSVLGVSSPWQWTCLTVLCGMGMLLAGRRRPVATGVSLGLALLMMPPAFSELWGYLVAQTVPQTAVDVTQNLLELVGSAAVVALIVTDGLRDRQERRLAPTPDPRPEDPTPDEDSAAGTRGTLASTDA
ncbi:hypothetical protein SSP24_08630 [Streptomyces spinoverrucosus]|uniref:Uncharacterized protein n=1 Tax=Streptomyces spinoverrucosus TaxID=284043 RepID=A0A4Y3VAU4_9ACTN|nr:hypothetical protein [Streptomyces spinoverrucosus]GEC03208.1 hypothetical protein SSP24_08630 [Streptomyces spinoverrucosus]GHB37388.1 hypothetical protein GCM10010397_03930 [Streptomyces spinoverrucosus]